jgi:hypothetical protein
MSHYIINTVNVLVGSFIIPYAKKNNDFYASITILVLIMIMTHLFGDQFTLNYLFDRKNNIRDDNCCICLEPLVSNLIVCEFAECHHQIHKTCAIEYVQNLGIGEIRCPICRL